MSGKPANQQKTLDALAEWVASARQQTPLLDNSADGLLSQLAESRQQYHQLCALAQQPRTLGLYGHCQQGKASLLSALSGADNGQIRVVAGGRQLNYLTHINPAHAPVRIAIRFVAADGDFSARYSSAPHFSVPHSFAPHFSAHYAASESAPADQISLRLLNEAELMQLVIQHDRRLHGCRHLDEQRLQQRLQQLRPLCQPRQQPAINQWQAAAVLQEWRYQHRQPLQPACQQQFINVLPQLDLNERAELCALLWGEQRELTRQWRQLAQTLQALGNASEVAAPLSLIVDNFSLPGEGLLNGEISARQLLVYPRHEGKYLPAVTTEAASLIMLVSELILPLASDGVLPGVDLLDIPGEGTGIDGDVINGISINNSAKKTDNLQPSVAVCNGNNGLAQSKIGWLLDYYRQRQQPDLLLICNATNDIRNTQQIAARLLRWQQDTRPARQADSQHNDLHHNADQHNDSQHNDSHHNDSHHNDNRHTVNHHTEQPTPPGLIWTITPYDLRFSEGQNPDESIQRLLGKPAELWGTLQVMEKRNLQRMLEWLAQALSTTQRQRRHNALIQRLFNHIAQQFAPLTRVAKAADSQALAQQAIRELQRQASHHGDLLQGLLPDLAVLQSLCQPQTPSSTADQLFHLNIDLLADAPPAREVTSPPVSDNAARAFRYWINHLRQWTQQAQQAEQLKLSPQTLAWLGNTLIITSYRLQLENRLQAVSQHSGQPAAPIQAEISNFLSWLGYASVPAEQRPASRINQGAAIFQPAASGGITKAITTETALTKTLLTNTSVNNTTAAKRAITPADALSASSASAAAQMTSGSTIRSATRSATKPQSALRLTRLADQPVHAATAYVYDWLIALYHQAQQNIGYRHPLDLSTSERSKLKKLLKKIAPPDAADAG